MPVSYNTHSVTTRVSERSAIVYALLDPATSEVRYIGRTVQSPEVRLQRHVSNASNGDETHRARWMRTLDGVPALQVLEEVPESLVDEREIAWIALGRSLGWPLTNISAGGGSNIGIKRSDETRALLSRIKLGVPIHTEESRRKIGEAAAQRRHTDETRKKIGDATRGKKKPPGTVGGFNTPKFKCADCDMVTRAGPLTSHQRATGHSGREPA